MSVYADYNAGAPTRPEAIAAMNRALEMGGNARITVDLNRQVVVRPNGEEIGFEIDPFGNDATRL